MSVFGAIDIGATGAGLGRVWMDTVANNLANIDTIHPADEEPFRAELVFAQERRNIRARMGEGVRVVSLIQQQGDPVKVLDPDHPFADEEGMVTRPVVDLTGQMTDMIVASRTYQVNLEVIRSGREAYQKALEIGR